MKTEEKIYSDQKSPNIGPDVKKWEKDQKDSKSKVEKDPEGTVEKTTKSLVEKGKEGPVTKVMADAPKQVRYKDALYVQANEPYIDRIDEFHKWYGQNKDSFPKAVGGGLVSPGSRDISFFVYKDKADAEAMKEKIEAGSFETNGPLKDDDNYNIGVIVGWFPNINPEHSKWLTEHGLKVETGRSGDQIVVKASYTPKYIRHKSALYVKAEDAKENEYSDAAVMAADFGIPPEDLEDLKKYKDDSGVSIFDLASLARSVSKKKKASGLRHAVRDKDIGNLDEWEDEQFDFLVIASFDGEASWEVVDGAYSAAEAEELVAEYRMAYGPSTPVRIHSMRRHYQNDRYPTEYDASVRRKRVTAVAKEYAEVIKGVKDSLVSLPLEWIGKDNSSKLLMHVQVPVAKGTSTFNKIRKAIKSGIIAPEGQKVQDRGTDGNFKEDEYSSAVFTVGKLEFHVSLELDEDRDKGTKKADIGVFTHIRK